MIASLKARLAVYLLVSQIFICVVIFVGFPIVGALDVFHLGGWIGYDKQTSAWETVSSQIVASLTRAPDGATTFQPTPALRARSQRNPRLRYAAFDKATKSAVPGSTPDLAMALSELDRLFPHVDGLSTWNGQIDSPGESLQVTLARTPFGDFYLAAAGYVFEWSDYWDITRWPVKPAISWFSPVLLASMFVVWLVLWREMRSLSALIAQANRIDFTSLGERLRPADIPSELRPVVASINSALARLDEGAARQRRFIANAAHELRTPIAILGARIDAIEASSPARPELQRDARQVQSILDQLLSTARATELPAMLRSTVDLAEIACAVATDHFPLARRNRRRIDFVAKDEALTVEGDARALASVIGNLIGNALRAEPENGVVIVQVEDDGVVAVIDHGPGVPETDRETIFEPFWRKSEATPGTGLGLAIARELVEKMRGRIWVEETPGGGATFRLSLPLASRAA